MNDEMMRELWRRLDAKRSTGHQLDLLEIVKVAQSEPHAFGMAELQLIIKSLGRYAGAFVIPPLIPRFIEDYLRGTSVRSLFDPWAGMGQLLIPIVKALGPQEALGATPNRKEQEIAALLANEENSIQWVLSDSLELLQSSPEQPFEVIVSAPPIGMRRVEETLKGLEGSITVQDEYGNLLLLKSCQYLAPDGVGFFIVPAGFLSRRSSARSVVTNLERFGLFVDALIALPSGTFKPETAIETAIVIIRREKRAQLFIAELSHDPGWNAQVAQNCKLHQAGEEPGQGSFVQANEFFSYNTWKSATITERMGATLGLPSVLLPEVATAIYLSRTTEPPGFEDHPNAVYLPMIGRSPAVASLSELTLKPHNYIQIVLDPNKAVTAYVAGFFSTPLGQMCRQSALSGVHIPKLSRLSLEKMRVYLPSLDMQLKTVEADTEITNRISELTTLQTNLWSEPRQIQRVLKKLEPTPQEAPREQRLQDWLNALPFPLASILWTYHASGEDHKARYEHLLHFFEALAMFHAAVLLSGFQTDAELFTVEREAMRETLRGDRMETSTFGVWVKFVARLSKEARSLWNSPKEEDKKHVQQMFCTTRWDVLEMLFAKEIVGVLQDTNGLRNKWLGHSGVVSEKTAHERRTELERHLARVRRVLGETWNMYPLVKPGMTRIVKGAYHFQVERIMGNQTPFEKMNVITSEQMEDGELYLLGVEESRPLRLVPLLKVMPSPETELNACYFYNRIEPKGMRFVSYHFEREADITGAFPDTVEALRTIWPTSD